jgi:hypothetical protein
MNSRILFAMIASAGVIGLNQLPGLAHGKPEHGGAFTEVKEYTFEVVSQDNGAGDAEDAKVTHIAEMSFYVWVKDPALKAVTTGTGELKISDGKKEVAHAQLLPANDKFMAQAKLPHRGRYTVAINFTPQGQNALNAKVPLNVK